MSTHKISISNLTVSYERHPAVHHINCEFHDGLTAILGPNGGGKSTLLKSIMGLVPVETGNISFNSAIEHNAPAAFLSPGGDSREGERLGEGVVAENIALSSEAVQTDLSVKLRSAQLPPLLTSPPLANFVRSGGEGLQRNQRKHKCSMAYLAQLPTMERDFPITVLDVVLAGHIFKMGPFAGLFRGMTHAHIQKAQDALALVDLSGFDNRPIATLSAGQFQRMMFARTIVQDAHVILLDEPFAGVDMRSTVTLLRLMQQWSDEGRIVLCVLHDVAMAEAHFPRAILLARELIAAGATTDVLQSDYLTRARSMAEAWDDDAALCRPEAA